MPSRVARGLASVVLLSACQGQRPVEPVAGSKPARVKTVATVVAAPSADPALTVPPNVPQALEDHLSIRLAALPGVDLIPKAQVEAVRQNVPACKAASDDACWQALRASLGGADLVYATVAKKSDTACQVTVAVATAPGPTPAPTAGPDVLCLAHELRHSLEEMVHATEVGRGLQVEPARAAECQGEPCTAGTFVCAPKRRSCQDANWDGCPELVEADCPNGEGCVDGACVAGKEGMVFVWEGRFRMGSSKEAVDLAVRLCKERGVDCRPSWWRTEQPPHWVALKGFWIDRTEVTQAAYNECVAAGACVKLNESQCRVWDPGSDKWQNGPKLPPKQKGDKLPMVCATYDEAKAYCAYRGKRLPTEAEWEKAARGTDERIYPWGNSAYQGTLANGCDKACAEIASRGWGREANVDDGQRFLAEVGSYPAGASPYGAVDMCGNVWEWVSDWYDEEYYSVSDRRDPKGPAEGQYRVVRGGSWANEADSLRANYRYQVDPTTRMTTVGFRCVMP